MQIVIDITEEYYKELVKNKDLPFRFLLEEATVNGIILPKGHGRLKDVDAFIKKVQADRQHTCYVQSWTADDVLNALNGSYAPTIIEADKEK